MARKKKGEITVTENQENIEETETTVETEVQEVTSTETTETTETVAVSESEEVPESDFPYIEKGDLLIPKNK